MAEIQKTDNGQQFGRSAYLLADGDQVSDWHLRIEETPGKVTVAQLGRAASALSPKGFMGNRVQVPPADRAKAARALIGKYRGLDVADGDIPAYLWGIAGMQEPGAATKAFRAEMLAVADAIAAGELPDDVLDAVGAIGRKAMAGPGSGPGAGPGGSPGGGMSMAPGDGGPRIGRVGTPGDNGKPGRHSKQPKGQQDDYDACVNSPELKGLSLIERQQICHKRHMVMGEVPSGLKAITDAIINGELPDDVLDGMAAVGAKGGPGSGYRGHLGRPGHQGGSAPMGSGGGGEQPGPAKEPPGKLRNVTPVAGKVPTYEATINGKPVRVTIPGSDATPATPAKARPFSQIAKSVGAREGAGAELAVNPDKLRAATREAYDRGVAEHKQGGKIDTAGRDAFVERTLRDHDMLDPKNGTTGDTVHSMLMDAWHAGNQPESWRASAHADSAAYDKAEAAVLKAGWERQGSGSNTSYSRVRNGITETAKITRPLGTPGGWKLNADVSPFAEDKPVTSKKRAAKPPKGPSAADRAAQLRRQEVGQHPERVPTK